MAEVVEQVKRVDGLVRARGVRLNAWCLALGVAPSTWIRWRNGVQPPHPVALALLTLVEETPELIGRLMELRAEVDCG